MRKRRDLQAECPDDFAPSSVESRCPRASRPGQQDFVPRNDAQARLMRMLEDDALPVVVAVGSAGSGKTACAAAFAARQLRAGKVSRIVISRPAVSADEDLGFLPGTVEHKLGPFLRPLTDQLAACLGAAAFRDMVADGAVETCALAYCRGRTFNDAVMILDEASCATAGQVKCFLTRIGRGSKAVLTGDLSQSDLGDRNGLQDLLDRIARADRPAPEIGVARFSDADVVRHPVIETILRLYGES